MFKYIAVIAVACLIAVSGASAQKAPNVELAFVSTSPATFMSQANFTATIQPVRGNDNLWWFIGVTIDCGDGNPLTNAGWWLSSGGYALPVTGIYLTANAGRTCRAWIFQQNTNHPSPNRSVSNIVTFVA
jgi:hypothetical protein